MSEGALIIRGKHNEESAATVYSERFAGAFERRIMLPVEVEPDGVEATFKDGLLTVLLRKSAKSRVKHIPINSGSSNVISH